MFSGIPEQSIDFFYQLALNNQRPWFQEHKEEFLTLVDGPFKALARESARLLNARAPKYGFQPKVSRIYRDARRLFGRGPYKDHLWLSLFRFGSESGGDHPVFWFELAPEGWSYGMGFWCAQASVMGKHRARIDADPRPLLKLHNRLARQEEFTLDGPEYSRKKPCAEPRLADWYNKKSLSVGHEEELSEALYTPALADRLVEGFSFLMPYYDYFSTLWAHQDPGKPV